MKTVSEQQWRKALLNTHGGTEKYPWELWLDGRPHLIERGVDYLCTDATFRKNLYRKQRKFGPIQCITHKAGFLIKRKEHYDIGFSGTPAVRTSDSRSVG